MIPNVNEFVVQIDQKTVTCFGSSEEDSDSEDDYLISEDEVDGSLSESRSSPGKRQTFFWRQHSADVKKFMTSNTFDVKNFHGVKNFDIENFDVKEF